MHPPRIPARIWIAACALGEALGIAGVALAYALADRGLAAPVPAILAGGAWEGLCLGLAQAAVLARAGVPRAAWVGVTVAAAVLGYGLSLAGGAGAGDPAQAAPPLLLILAGAGAAELAMGAVMGAAQAWAAAGRLAFGAWLWRSALGWALAMGAIFLGATTIPAGLPLAAVAGVGALSGAAAGAALGAVTAPALQHRDAPARH